MEKRTRYIVLTPPNDSEPIGGVMVIETSGAKTSCFVSFFGLGGLQPTILIDDLVKVRQFEVSPSFSEIDLDPAIGLACDLVVGVFSQSKKLLMSGSTFGGETEEQKERLKIALEQDGRLAHFLGLAKEVFAVEDQLDAEENLTFLQQTEGLLFELFSYGVPDKSLSRFVPNSKWVKIFLKTDVVGVGIVENHGQVTAIGLAFPVLSRKAKHKAVDNNFSFFPQNSANPNGFGYYIVLQHAKDGSVVKIK